MLAAMTVLAAAAADEHKSGGLPQLYAPDFAPQLAWLALTFIALFFIMSRVALPRIGEVIEERRERVERDLATAGRLKRETEEARAAYEKALSDARSNAHGIAKDKRDKLNAEVDKERARVESLIATRIADAETRIGATKSAALSSVNDVAAETAAAIVSKLIKQDVSPGEIKSALKAAAE